jgi:hypothetical protein
VCREPTFQKIVTPASSSASSHITSPALSVLLALFSVQDEGDTTFETSGTTHGTTQRHIPEDLNPQQPHTSHLKLHSFTSALDGGQWSASRAGQFAPCEGKSGNH